MEHAIKLDRERKLKYGFKALRLLRQQFSASIQEVLQNISIDEMPRFVWAGLIWEDPSLTIERVEELLDEKVPDVYTPLQIVKLVYDAMFHQLGLEENQSPPFATTITSTQHDESRSKSDSTTNNSNT